MLQLLVVGGCRPLSYGGQLGRIHADLVLFVLPGKRAAHARLGSGRRSRCHQGKQTQIEHVTEYGVNQGLEDGRGVDRGMTKYSKCPIGVLKAVFLVPLPDADEVVGV